MMWKMMEMMGWADGGSNKMFMKLFKSVLNNLKCQTCIPYFPQVHYGEQQEGRENKDDRARPHALGEGNEEQADVLLHPQDTPTESSSTSG